LFGFPDQKDETTHYAIRIPWALGLIATRSTDTPVVGIEDLKKEHEKGIRDGMVAYGLLRKLRQGDTSPETRAAFEKVKKDLGYGLLLKKYTPNVTDATNAQIQKAVDDTIPRVAPLFWSFRIMVGLGFFMLFVFAASFYNCATRKAGRKRWLLRLGRGRFRYHGSPPSSVG